MEDTGTLVMLMKEAYSNLSAANVTLSTNVFVLFRQSYKVNGFVL